LTARSEGFGGRRTSWNSGSSLPGSQVAPRSRYSGLTGIGASLRDAREARGLTFETAERDTHIPRHHLQALEEERFDAFHAPVYLRGFLRSYSQYLKLDSGELLDLLPPDRPLEDDRLMPVSRLGRPRGPSEAERERRDPAARDAPPLTSTAFEPVPRNVEPPEDIQPGVLVDIRRTESGSRVVPRLDPLGRLGWPESVDQAVQVDEPSEANPKPRRSFSRVSWEQPLSPRRTRHWNATPSTRGVLPEDMRGTLRGQSMMMLAGVVCVLAVLWLLMRVIAGPDVSPTVLEAAGSDATVKVPVSAGQAGAHGQMPNVMGTDLNTALAALQKSGVVPVVVAQSAGDPSGLPVTAQVPNPGEGLHPQTAVLLVVGSGN
jgi:hypothetical protein